MELIKQMYCKKLYGEYQKFKRELLRMGKNEVFANAYKIDIMITLYEILFEKAESLSEKVLWDMLLQPNLLETYYLRWMGKKDSHFEELLEHVEEELMEEELQLAS